MVFDWIANLSSIISKSRRGDWVGIVEEDGRSARVERGKGAGGGGSGEERTRWRKEGKGGPCVSKGFRVFRITSCSAPELVCRDPRVTPLYWHIVERDPNTCDIIPNCEQSCRRSDLRSSNRPWIENKSPVWGKFRVFSARIDVCTRIDYVRVRVKFISVVTMRRALAGLEISLEIQTFLSLTYENKCHPLILCRRKQRQELSSNFLR